MQAQFRQQILAIANTGFIRPGEDGLTFITYISTESFFTDIQVATGDFEEAQLTNWINYVQDLLARVAEFDVADKACNEWNELALQTAFGLIEDILKKKESYYGRAPIERQAPPPPAPAPMPAAAAAAAPAPARVISAPAPARASTIAPPPPPVALSRPVSVTVAASGARPAAASSMASSLFRSVEYGASTVRRPATPLEPLNAIMVEKYRALLQLKLSYIAVYLKQPISKQHSISGKVNANKLRTELTKTLNGKVDTFTGRLNHAIYGNQTLRTDQEKLEAARMLFEHTLKGLVQETKTDTQVLDSSWRLGSLKAHLWAYATRLTHLSTRFPEAESSIETITQYLNSFELTQNVLPVSNEGDLKQAQAEIERRRSSGLARG